MNFEIALFFRNVCKQRSILVLPVVSLCSSVALIFVLFGPDEHSSTATESENAFCVLRPPIDLVLFALGGQCKRCVLFPQCSRNGCPRAASILGCTRFFFRSHWTGWPCKRRWLLQILYRIELLSRIGIVNFHNSYQCLWYQWCHRELSQSCWLDNCSTRCCATFWSIYDSYPNTRSWNCDQRLKALSACTTQHQE